MLDRVKSNWFQVAEVNLIVEPNTLKQIERDPVCADTLAEIIPELCFNGIKHGGSNGVTISLSFKSDQVVYLEVANNGSVHEINTPDGLGTKFLNEASISWERVQENGVTITKAEFAYSLEKALPN
jgi:two-component sensor histidine kinase